jgi:hypothetical protein
MNDQENKLLIKIGQHFEANASGNTAISVVFAIILCLMLVGYSFF